MAGLFCLSSGVLLRRHLRPGDLLVADRSFWSFALPAFRPLRGTDLLVRGRYAARIDWRKGRRFGRDDRFITLKRPADKDASRVMSPQLWKRRPVPIARARFRTQPLLRLATLLDPVL